MQKLLILAAYAASSFTMEKPARSTPTPPAIVQTLSSSIGPVMQVKYTPDGSSLITASPLPQIQIWNTSTYQNPTLIETKIEGQSTLSVNPNGTQCALGYSLLKDAGTIALINITRKTIAEKLTTHHSKGITRVQYKDPKSLLAALGNGTCTLWDLSSHKITATFESNTQGCALDIACNPVKPHEFAAVYPQDQIIALWDIRNKKTPATTASFPVYCSTLAYNKKGQLAVGGAYNVYVYNKNMEPLARYDLYANKMAPGQSPLAVAVPVDYVPLMPNGLTFIPNNDSVLIAPLDDKSVVVYNLEDQTQSLAFAFNDVLAPQAVDVHPDGQTMAISGYTPTNTYIYDCSDFTHPKDGAASLKNAHSECPFDNMAAHACNLWCDGACNLQ